MNNCKDYSLLSSLPRIEWTRQFRYRGITPEAGNQYAALVEHAAAFCFDALASTWECESGYFWSSVDCNDLFGWLQADQPAIAAAILRSNLKEVLERRIMSLVNLMRPAESLARYMKPGSVAKILVHEEEEHQLSAVLAYLDVDHNWVFDDRFQSDFEGWYEEEGEDEQTPVYYVDDELLETSGYGAWAKETAAREVLKVLRGKATLRQTRQERLSQFPMTSATSDAVQQIRAMNSSKSMLFVINSRSLPKDFQGGTSERICFAVTVSDLLLGGLQLSTELAGDAEIFTRVFQSPGTGITVPMFRLATDILWVDAQRTFEHLQKMRREVPILFIGTDKCCLVKYRFNHFDKLTQLFNESNEAKSDPFDYKQVTLEHLKAFSNVSGEVPSLRHHVLDLTLACNPAAVD
ncbi:MULTISPECIES: hypothetical protein [unclassified Caballeronia]|uniref:hypothetical protein n=1 Tax=unclassified Caballeronia TaxID=2646786 RepID=UPI00202902DD|nr:MULTISPECIES: hypothetical protein [unclassified Caballeronia]MDR5770113.1 hypothetical protein [Caballeronia sp. LZ028]